VDYRQQVERQQKEQKSTTSLLAMAVYGLIALVLGGSALAGYGTYVIFGELSDQKATAEQIRADLADNLVLLNQRVETLSASFVQEQNRNQEETLKLRGDLDTLSAQTQTSLKAQQTELAKRDAALKARQNEIKELQGRINRIERRLDLPTPAPKPQANN
jgi:DNA repair exonuclease SbcCD ATPase subunit